MTIRPSVKVTEPEYIAGPSCRCWQTALRENFPLRVVKRDEAWKGVKGNVNLYQP